MSIIQKMKDVEIKEDGSVVHKHLLSKDGTNRRSFKDLATFKRWLAQ